MAYSDRELLARLIQCEAGGEGEDGMKAVAGVVMNRVHAKGGEYARVGQGSIRNIIFQPYQFVCASETEGGAYNPQNIYNMRPEQIHRAPLAPPFPKTTRPHKGGSAPPPGTGEPWPHSPRGRPPRPLPAGPPAPPGPGSAGGS